MMNADHIDRRIKRIEERLNVAGSVPEWAISRAQGLARLEPMFAKVEGRPPRTITDEETLEDAIGLARKYSSEEAYFDGLRNERLPDNVEALLGELGC